MVEDEADEVNAEILYCYNCDLPVETVVIAMIREKIQREVCSLECKREAEKRF